MSDRNVRRQRRLAEIILLAASVCFALGLGELISRLIGRNVFQGPGRMFWIRHSTTPLTLDFTLGFRPLLGTGAYTETGTLQNAYSLAKRPGVTRVLFVGDSVTARGKIIRVLEQLYGSERFEYWNAGVEAFNTIQEVVFYRQYNARIQPDRVVLTFHNNDFQTIPVAFRDRAGKLVVYAPPIPSTFATRWLVAHSGLYRMLLGALLYLDRRPDSAVVDETRAALAELKALLDRDHIPLRVLLLPAIAPYRQWLDQERESREHALRILASLGIAHLDLFDDLERVIAAGATFQESPGDRWHPSDEAAAAFARHAYAWGVLDDSPHDPR
jgi:hypothetical protein